jgi:hypothetical protein
LLRQCTLPLANPLPPQPTRLLTAGPLLINPLAIFLQLDMSQPSSSLSLQDLFNAALQEYENQTGTKLVEHPLARQFETCDSVDSITAILQDQAQKFHEFRGDDGKLMKSLKSSIDTLYPLSINTILAAGLVHPKSPIGFLISNRHSTAIPTCESNIRWHRHPTCCMSPSSISSAYFVTSKSCRRSKTLVLVMMHSLICFHLSRTSSAD